MSTALTGRKGVILVKKAWSEGNEPVRYLACVVSLLVSGCAGSPTGNDTSGLFGQNVVGNEASVTVSNVYSDIDALLMADNHCANYGRIARFNRMEPPRAIFDCVRRQNR
jgi:hypothetical protein